MLLSWLNRSVIPKILGNSFEKMIFFNRGLFQFVECFYSNLKLQIKRSRATRYDSSEISLRFDVIIIINLNDLFFLLHLYYNNEINQNQ